MYLFFGSFWAGKPPCPTVFSFCSPGRWPNLTREMYGANLFSKRTANKHFVEVSPVRCRRFCSAKYPTATAKICIILFRRFDRESQFRKRKKMLRGERSHYWFNLLGTEAGVRAIECPLLFLLVLSSEIFRNKFRIQLYKKFRVLYNIQHPRRFTNVTFCPGQREYTPFLSRNEIHSRFYEIFNWLYVITSRRRLIGTS